MNWASAIFPFENNPERPSFVKRIWRTRSVTQPSFISVAVPYWEMVFVTFGADQRQVFVRGPETTATLSEIPRGAEFFGVQFELGTYMPETPIRTLVDSAVELHPRGKSRFWLNGHEWEIPTFENADIFAKRLASAGVIVRNPDIDDVLSRRIANTSDRSIQRKFIQATGLTFSTIRQIERAERACGRLRDGESALDVVDAEGYSDQAHLTRSLRRFMGLTPRAISRGR